MKRIIFYADIIIIVGCFTGGFVAFFWLLNSTIMAEIFKADSSAPVTLLFLSLYVLLFLLLAVFMLFAAGFLIHRANIQYKKRARSFTVLQPNVTGGRQESALPPASYFAAGPFGFGYFIPEQGMSPSHVPFTAQGKSLSPGKSPGGNKPRLTLVKGYETSPGDLPTDTPGAPSPKISAGRGAAILPFPRGQKNHRKG
jgi:hypothetical protein